LRAGSVDAVIDLHCHLLPGVDDGPSTLEESTEFARLAVEAGTTTIVATPHIELVEVCELPDRVREVQERLDRDGIELRVEVGGELKPRSVAFLSHDELETIAHGPAGARWVLFEVPFAGIDADFHEAAAELRSRGFTPVLAHPERATGFAADGLPGLQEEIDRGSPVQMNTGPLAGRESVEREDAAGALLRLGLASAIATDAHAPSRPWTLRMARQAIVAKTGNRALAERLTEGGPRELLERGVPIAASRPPAG
jgi:protein-tyrosine phosphatase